MFCCTCWAIFKKDLAPAEKKELLEILENYRQSRVPLLVPITLLHHYAQKFTQTYLQNQYFLNPPPIELQLRCHV